jgi:two-component system chemotaxis response regulator CheY
MVKALIVDDSQESRFLLGRILKKSFNTEIVEAKDGKDALRKIPSEKPDIVFLDYEMPFLNGKETLQAIRSNPEYKDLPVVMVTSHSERDLVRELLSYKVSGYLTKPLLTDYIVKLMPVVFPKFNDSI